MGHRAGDASRSHAPALSEDDEEGTVEQIAAGGSAETTDLAKKEGR
jgi:hypothetical protein